MYAGMVPLLSLGLPFNASMALLMSAFMVHGITPGPMFITEHSDLFWGLIASMFIGNVVLLIINLPLVGVWASLLRVDFSILMPLITFITFAGGYAINNSVFDMGIMVVTGMIGFFLSACGYNMAALAVGLFLSLSLIHIFPSLFLMILAHFKTGPPNFIRQQKSSSPVFNLHYSIITCCSITRADDRPVPRRSQCLSLIHISHASKPQN